MPGRLEAINKLGRKAMAKHMYLRYSCGKQKINESCVVVLIQRMKKAQW